MPQVPIIMPQLGESIAEATIVDIKVKPGDEVVDDQEIIDVETNKAVMGVTTPCKGKIGKITVELKETYPVGTVLGYVEASEQDAARFAKHAPPPPQQQEVAEEIPARADQEVAPARGQ
jgi:pyruvate/2-oxoglutarate dehydrogenase complex dihydrolipoamide acyltransferase (E2) component